VEVFLSTQRLWQRLDLVQGFQVPRYSADQLAEMVHGDYQRMYRGYFKGRRELGPDQLIEIQFEQLIADAPAVIRQIYEQLDLGDSGAVVEAIQASMSQRQSHESARYQQPPEEIADIMRQWGQYALTFGYDRNSGQPVAAPTLLKTRA
jgi:LPS sulfotransferase NodH